MPFAFELFSKEIEKDFKVVGWEVIFLWPKWTKQTPKLLVFGSVSYLNSAGGRRDLHPLIGLRN